MQILCCRTLPKRSRRAHRLVEQAFQRSLPPTLHQSRGRRREQTSSSLRFLWCVRLFLYLRIAHVERLFLEADQTILIVSQQSQSRNDGEKQTSDRCRHQWKINLTIHKILISFPALDSARVIFKIELIILEPLKRRVIHFRFLSLAAYGVCQRFVAEHIEKKSNVNEMSALGNATSGFLAAFFSSFTLCPTELIKCKLQALHEMKQAERISPYQLTKQIIRTEGITGMFRGLTPTFFREMPGYFFFFGGYELTRDFLAKPGQSKDDIGPLKTM